MKRGDMGANGQGMTQAGWICGILGTVLNGLLMLGCRTRREIIALRRGLPIFRGSGSARLGLSESDALRLAEALPLPVFDADRRLRELDERERRGRE